MDCPLCKILSNEKVLFENDLVFLVKTKDSKGHKTRIMSCTKRHVKEPTFAERVYCMFLLAEYMNETGEYWYMVDSTYSTYPDHFHNIACDLESTQPIEQMLLDKTSKVLFPLRI